MLQAEKFTFGENPLLDKIKSQHHTMGYPSQPHSELVCAFLSLSLYLGDTRVWSVKAVFKRNLWSP